MIVTGRWLLDVNKVMSIVIQIDDKKAEVFDQEGFDRLLTAKGLQCLLAGDLEVTDFRSLKGDVEYTAGPKRSGASGDALKLTIQAAHLQTRKGFREQVERARVIVDQLEQQGTPVSSALLTQLEEVEQHLQVQTKRSAGPSNFARAFGNFWPSFLPLWGSTSSSSPAAKKKLQ